MTRKRYCKLVQSYGHTRNVANYEARACRIRGQAYADSWEETRHYHECFPGGAIVTNVTVRRNGFLHIRRKARRAV